MQPIEQVFSELKWLLCTAAKTTVVSFATAIGGALAAVTPSKVRQLSPQ